MAESGNSSGLVFLIILLALVGLAIVVGWASNKSSREQTKFIDAKARGEVLPPRFKDDDEDDIVTLPEPVYQRPQPRQQPRQAPSAARPVPQPSRVQPTQRPASSTRGFVNPVGGQASAPAPAPMAASVRASVARYDPGPIPESLGEAVDVSHQVAIDLLVTLDALNEPSDHEDARRAGYVIASLLLLCDGSLSRAVLTFRNRWNLEDVNAGPLGFYEDLRMLVGQLRPSDLSRASLRILGDALDDVPGWGGAAIIAVYTLNNMKPKG